MSETTAVRTLLKSIPELWTACSDAGALAGHLGAFGEITIRRLEPETTVAWESDRASGTVTLEPAGWGTKVTMTAITVQERPSDQLERAADEAPPVAEIADVKEALAAPTGLLARLLARLRSRQVAPVSGLDGDDNPAPDETRAAAVSAEPARAVAPMAERAQLEAALDSLGQAHHRPFSNRDLSRS